jgi:hypothetical protein
MATHVSMQNMELDQICLRQHLKTIGSAGLQVCSSLQQRSSTTFQYETRHQQCTTASNSDESLWTVSLNESSPVRMQSRTAATHAWLSRTPWPFTLSVGPACTVPKAVVLGNPCLTCQRQPCITLQKLELHLPSGIDTALRWGRN